MLADYLAPISEGTPAYDSLLALENGDKSVFDIAPQLCLLSDKSSETFPDGLGGAAGKALEDLINRKPDWPPSLLDDLPKPKDAFKRLLAAALRDNPKVPLSSSIPSVPATLPSGSRSSALPTTIGKESRGLFQPHSPFTPTSPAFQPPSPLPPVPAALGISHRGHPLSQAPLRPRGGIPGLGYPTDWTSGSGHSCWLYAQGA